MNQNIQLTCQQKLTWHTHCIQCLLLNNNEDLIILGSWDKSFRFWDKQKGWFCYLINSILVIEQSQKDKTWGVIQKIELDQFGFRLCFINDNQFTLQPRCKEQMYVFEMNGEDKYYYKTKKLVWFTVSIIIFKTSMTFGEQEWFEYQFNKEKQNGEFITEQSIKLDHFDNYGSLNDDGEYLITWDSQSKKIQIRKCIEK